MIRVLTWLWRQERAQYRYTAEDVNVWAAMVSRNLAIPHELACVTDMPRGIDTSIEIIPLPDVLGDIRSSRWPAERGLPQCYRRLHMWHPKASRWYGRRFVCMDLDCVVVGSLDPLFERDDEIVLCRGKNPAMPYNGSMLLLRAGSRPSVYTQITPAGIDEATARYKGSDQAWLCHALGAGEATWGEADGVYRYTTRQFPAPVKNPRHVSAGARVWPRRNLMDPDYPANMRVIFFPGLYKPRDLMADYPLIRQHYHA